MEKVIINGYEFIVEDLKTAKVVFSTAENDFNMNINTLEGEKNIKNIKKWFKIDAVAYLNQIHSDFVHTYDGEIYEGDAIITDKAKTAIGIFTADCVPVIIYDTHLKVAAAIHSGWRGTYNLIVSKAIEKMNSQYGSQSINLKVFIGPHMRDCCYEVGDEVAGKFKESETYKEADIFKGKKLSMEKCILKQLEKNNVPKENIKTLDLCTYCSNLPKLYSYRKGQNSKRLFSFVFIK